MSVGSSSSVPVLPCGARRSAVRRRSPGLCPRPRRSRRCRPSCRLAPRSAVEPRRVVGPDDHLAAVAVVDRIGLDRRVAARHKCGRHSGLAGSCPGNRRRRARFRHPGRPTRRPMLHRRGRPCRRAPGRSPPFWPAAALLASSDPVTSTTPRSPPSSTIFPPLLGDRPRAHRPADVEHRVQQRHRPTWPSGTTCPPSACMVPLFLTSAPTAAASTETDTSWSPLIANDTRSPAAKPMLAAVGVDAAFVNDLRRREHDIARTDFAQVAHHPEPIAVAGQLVGAGQIVARCSSAASTRPDHRR